MLINPQYEALLGSVERVGKSSVQTLFYQVMGLPIFPQETYFVTGSTMFSWSNVKVMPLSQSLPSILKAYVVGWTGVAGIYVALLGVALFFIPPNIPGDPMPFGHTILSPIVFVLGLGAMAVGLLAMIVLRRPLCAEELAKRAIYEVEAGAPVDPAMLPNAWSLRDDLKRKIARAGEAAGMGSFLFDQWKEIIFRPELAARADVLRAALTLTRVARGTPEEGVSPESYDPLHAQIWARLRAM